MQFSITIEQNRQLMLNKIHKEKFKRMWRPLYNAKILVTPSRDVINTTGNTIREV